MKLTALIVLRIILSLSSLLASVYLSTEYGIIDNGQYFEIFKYSQVIALISVLGFPSLILRESNTLQLHKIFEVLVLLLSALLWVVLICLKELNFNESLAVLNISIISSSLKLKEAYLVSRNQQFSAIFSSLSTVHILFLVVLIIANKYWLVLLVNLTSIIVAIYLILILIDMRERIKGIMHIMKSAGLFVSSIKIFTSKINTIVMNHADTIFLFPVLSAEQLGVYAIIQRFLSSGTNFMASVRSFFTPKFKHLLAHQLNEAFQDLYRRVNWFIALSTIIGLCIFHITLESVLKVIFNTDRNFSYLQIVLFSIPFLINNSFGLVGLRLVLKFKEKYLFRANSLSLILFGIMIITASLINLVTIEVYLVILSTYAFLINYLKKIYDTIY